MTFLPIVQRELRVAARSRFMYWLRTAGALAALYAVAKVMISQSSNNPAHLGGQLFATLNLFLFASIWLLVPLMTADCISREKREGTLGHRSVPKGSCLASCSRTPCGLPRSFWW
jgi:hypothetical protein